MFFGDIPQPALAVWVIATGAALVALLAGLRAQIRCARALRDADLSRRLRALEIESAAQADDVSKTLKMVKRLSNRESVARARAKRHAEPEPEPESDEQWKERMNRELANRRVN